MTFQIQQLEILVVSTIRKVLAWGQKLQLRVAPSCQCSTFRKMQKIVVPNTPPFKLTLTCSNRRCLILQRSLLKNVGENLQRASRKGMIQRMQALVVTILHPRSRGCSVQRNRVTKRLKILSQRKREIQSAQTTKQ